VREVDDELEHEEAFPRLTRELFAVGDVPAAGSTRRDERRRCRSRGGKRMRRKRS